MTIKRILVVLEGIDRAMLNGAARLAAALDAELKGLFVEDVTLFQVAQLPISQEINIYTASTNPLDGRRVTRQIRAQSRRVRRALALAAAPQRIRWTMDIRRGKVSVEVERAIREADLVIMPRTSDRRGELTTTARHVLDKMTCPVLLLDEELPDRPSVIVVYDGSERAQSAIELSAEGVRQTGGYITVITVPGPGTSVRTCQRLAFEFLASVNLIAQCRWLEQVNPLTVVHTLHEAEADLFVLPVTLMDPQDMVATVARAELPTLLVR
ncbi:MAG: hypothetical protein ACFB51_19340 [Anaerolineae bacterium]